MRGETIHFPSLCRNPAHPWKLRGCRFKANERTGLLQTVDESVQQKVVKLASKKRWIFGEGRIAIVVPRAQSGGSERGSPGYFRMPDRLTAGGDC